MCVGKNVKTRSCNYHVVWRFYWQTFVSCDRYSVFMVPVWWMIGVLPSREDCVSLCGGLIWWWLTRAGRHPNRGPEANYLNIFNCFMVCRVFFNGFWLVCLTWSRALLWLWWFCLPWWWRRLCSSGPEGEGRLLSPPSAPRSPAAWLKCSVAERPSRPRSLVLRRKENHIISNIMRTIVCTNVIIKLPHYKRPLSYTSGHAIHCYIKYKNDWL